MKVQIKTEFGKNSKVLIDGHDVSDKLIGVDVNLKAGYIPVVKLDIVPDEIEIEGDFDVVKKISQEKCTEHGTEIIINGSKVAECTNPEDIAKAISENINNTSHAKFFGTGEVIERKV